MPGWSSPRFIAARTGSHRGRALLCSVSALALALACTVPAPAIAQEITQGGGNGGTGGSTPASMTAGGSGGIAGGGGGGGGDATSGAIGGAGGDAGNPGTDGTPSLGTGGLGGAGGGLYGGGGGGGGGGGNSGTPGSDDGDDGGSGSAGNSLSTSHVTMSTDVSAATGGSGPTSDPDSGSGGGGGGGGGGGLVLTGAEATLITQGHGIFGGNGGDGDLPYGGAGGGGAGLVLVNGGTITVNDGAVGSSAITGGDGGNTFTGGSASGGGGGAGVFLVNGGELDNQTGAIGGGDGGMGSGSVGYSGGAGVLSNEGTVINAGTIEGGRGGKAFFSTGGDGGAGIEAWGGSITNTGTITGGWADDGFGGVGAGGKAGAGIVFRDGKTAIVTNSGNISGGTYGTIAGVGIAGAASGGITVINGGLIVGGMTDTGTQGNAITFAGGDNRLELLAGYGFTGNVVAGGGANNVLAFGGTADANFDVSQIGAAAQFQQFTSLEKTGSSTWTLTGSNPAYGGDANVLEGTLDIAGQFGSANSFIGYAGADPDATAAVVVAGTGSDWTLGTNLFVGRYGTGTLDIAGGAQVSGYNVLTGYDPGDKGTITVTGPGSTLTVYDLQVGRRGAGELIIAGGGAVVSTDQWNYIAASPGSTGTMTVTGDGSTWSGDAFNIGASGTGTLTVAKGGKMKSTGNISMGIFGGTGTLNIGGAAGDTAAAAGIIEAPTLTFGANGTLVFNHTDTDYVFSAELQSAGTGSHAIDHIAGNTTLTGDSSLFAGTTTVSGGTLLVNGTLGGTVDVESGGTLGGSGTVGSTVVDGTLSAGNSPGTLTIAGDLTLNGGSTSVFELYTPGVVGGAGNDLVEVQNNLTLGGALDARVAAAGYYRLFDYGGTRTGEFDSGTLTGTGGFTPVFSNDPDIRYDTPNQVNLSVLAAGQTMQFWDGGNTAANGIVDGGNGTWSGFGTNWTDSTGSANGSWVDSVGVFMGLPGTVTVDGTVGFDTLQFKTDGYRLTGGTLALNPANGTAGTFNIDNGVTTIVDSVVADGTGTALRKTGSGTLVLKGSNTYTGGTQLLAGTVSVSSDANLGDTSGDLTFDGGTLRNTAGLTTARNITLDAGGGTFQADTDLALNGVISGAGSLTKAGAGILTLSSVNLYSGGTTISQGGLTATVTGALGTGAVDVKDGAALAFTNNTSAEDLAITLGDHSTIRFNDASSAGAATIASTQGYINFYDSTNAGSATIMNDFGGTSFNANSSAGNSDITAKNYGTIDFYDNATAGTATLTGMADGIIRFHGDTTADGATVVNQAGGTVDISDLTAGGIGIGSLSGDGKVIVGAKALTLGGLGTNDSIGGTIEDGTGNGGSLVKTGTGTLTLTGANTYTGGTTVNAGTLQVGNGGTTGSLMGDVDIGAAGTFALDRSNDVAFAGALSGTGHFNISGGGTLLYDGNGAGFAGTTTIAAGGLIVGSDATHDDAVLGGAFTVENGATLGGHGTLGDVAVDAGGTLAPGNSIGTLHTGALAYGAGATYAVELADTGNTAGIDNDLTLATGVVNIDAGAIVHVTPENGTDTGTTYTPGLTYTIITSTSGAATGVTGTFGTVTDDYLYLDFTDSYDSHNVYLTSKLANASFCLSGFTVNQCATAGGVQSQGSGTVFNAIANLTDPDMAAAAFDALSGEIHASGKTALIADSHLISDAINDHIRASFAALGHEQAPALAYAGTGGNAANAAIGSALVPEETARMASWGAAFGAWGRTDGDGNAAALDHATGGFVAGLDGLVTDSVRLGVIAAYSHSSFSVDDRSSSGDSDTYHLGVYGGTQVGALGIRGGAAYGWSHIETNRSVAFPGFTDELSAAYDAGLFQAFGELSYRIDTPAVALEPFVNLAHVSLATDGFTEKGGAAALTSPGDTTATTFTTLGIRASTAFDLGDIAATAHGMLGWRHAFGDTVPTSTHVLAGGDAFTIAGTPIAEDAAVIEAGLDFAIAPNATLGLTYSGQFASGTHDNSARAVLNVKF